VQSCLAHTPLYFPEDSPDGQKLNIEEKKTRNLNGGSSGGGGGGGGGSGGMNRNMSESKYSGGPRIDRGNDRGNNDRGGNDRNSGDRGNDRGGADRALNRGQSSGGILRAPRGGNGSMSNNAIRGTSFNRNADNRTGTTGGGVVRGGNGQGNGSQAASGGGGGYARR